MYRKSNTIATASLYQKEENGTPFSEWKVYRQLSDQLFILYRQQHNTLSYKVLYIHKFTFKIPSWISSAEKYLLLYSTPDRLQKTSQKIKYYRHKNCMYAQDVASYLGIDRKSYSRYEELSTEYCSLPLLEKLALLYQIPVTELLDDYHLFLYNGQGNTVLQFRKSLHLTQQELAEKLNVNKVTVRCWEKEYHRMTRETYNSLFVQKILE